MSDAIETPSTTVSVVPPHASSALYLVYGMQGLLLAAFTVQIPAFREQLGVSLSVIGLLLSIAPAVAAAASPLAAIWVRRWGSRNALLLSFIATSVLFVALAHVSQLALFSLLLCAYGPFAALMGVAINRQAVAVEALLKKPKMSGWHATYSFGGFLGALLGARLLAAGFGADIHLFVTAMVAVAGVAVARHRLPSTVDGRTDQAAVRSRDSREKSSALLLIGLIMLGIYLAEVVSEDWSVLYVRTDLRAEGSVAALALSAFSFFTMVGRVVGNRLISSVGSSFVLGAGGVLASLGLVTAASATFPWVAIMGFGLIGLGLSCSVPIVYSIAGSLPRVDPVIAISFVTACGFIGQVAASPFIGVVADHFTLRAALRLALVITMLVAIGSFILGRLYKSEVKSG